MALEADEVWIWTDVDGIMTTDPKIVSAARMLPQLSYQEAAEMAILEQKPCIPAHWNQSLKKTSQLEYAAFSPRKPGYTDN